MLPIFLHFMKPYPVHNCPCRDIIDINAHTAPEVLAAATKYDVIRRLLFLIFALFSRVIFFLPSLTRVFVCIRSGAASRRGMLCVYQERHYAGNRDRISRYLSGTLTLLLYH